MIYFFIICISSFLFAYIINKIITKSKKAHQVPLALIEDVKKPPQDPFALFEAVKKYATIKEINQLIKSGIDVNIKDEHGSFALMHAAQKGSEHGAEMMRLLIDAGADVNKQNRDRWTALMYAAGRGDDARARRRGCRCQHAEQIRVDRADSFCTVWWQAR